MSEPTDDQKQIAALTDIVQMLVRVVTDYILLEHSTLQPYASPRWQALQYFLDDISGTIEQVNNATYETQCMETDHES